MASTICSGDRSESRTYDTYPRHRTFLPFRLPRELFPLVELAGQLIKHGEVAGEVESRTRGTCGTRGTRRNTRELVSDIGVEQQSPDNCYGNRCDNRRDHPNYQAVPSMA